MMKESRGVLKPWHRRGASLDLQPWSSRLDKRSDSEVSELTGGQFVSIWRMGPIL